MRAKIRHHQVEAAFLYAVQEILEDDGDVMSSSNDVLPIVLAITTFHGQKILHIPNYLVSPA